MDRTAPWPTFGRGWKASGGVFDLPAIEDEIGCLEAESGEAGFWDDARAAQDVMRRLGDLRGQVGAWRRLTQTADELATLAELAAEDPELATEVEREAGKLADEVDQLELDSTLGGPYDASDALLVVHSGEGGIDAQDWASMLARMYVRWAERRGLKAEVLDTTEGEEAGIKNATIEIRGPRAYGYAKAERRLPPAGPVVAVRRGAPAAHGLRPGRGVAGDVETTRNRHQRRRSAGRHVPVIGGRRPARQQDELGGPHHPPADRHRRHLSERTEQIQNRETAMKILRARLLERAMRQDAEERARLKGEHTGGRLRQPHPLLRPAPLHPGHGPPHRRQHRRRARRPGRRDRSLHRRLAASADRAERRGVSAVTRLLCLLALALAFSGQSDGARRTVGGRGGHRRDAGRRHGRRRARRSDVRFSERADIRLRSDGETADHADRPALPGDSGRNAVPFAAGGQARDGRLADADGRSGNGGRAARRRTPLPLANLRSGRRRHRNAGKADLLDRHPLRLDDVERARRDGLRLQQRSVVQSGDSRPGRADHRHAQQRFGAKPNRPIRIWVYNSGNDFSGALRRIPSRGSPGPPFLVRLDSGDLAGRRRVGSRPHHSPRNRAIKRSSRRRKIRSAARRPGSTKASPSTTRSAARRNIRRSSKPRWRRTSCRAFAPSTANFPTTRNKR